jgi:hypothetical protein
MTRRANKRYQSLTWPRAYYYSENHLFTLAWKSDLKTVYEPSRPPGTLQELWQKPWNGSKDIDAGHISGSL